MRETSKRDEMGSDKLLIQLFLNQLRKFAEIDEIRTANMLLVFKKEAYSLPKNSERDPKSKCT